MAEPSVRAVVWDLGGVLVRTEDPRPRHQWENKLGLQQGDLSQLVFDSQANERASRGEITAGELWRWVGDELGLDEQTLKQLAIEFWGGDRLDLKLIEQIRALRPSRKTGLLSNAWSSLRKQIQTLWQIEDVFDEIVISAEVGLAKPEPAIFELILNQLSVEPQEAIFVDDFVENIAAAAAVGMRVIHFRTPQQATRELEALLTK